MEDTSNYFSPESKGTEPRVINVVDYDSGSRRGSRTVVSPKTREEINQNFEDLIKKKADEMVEVKVIGSLEPEETEEEGVEEEEESEDENKEFFDDFNKLSSA